MEMCAGRVERKKPRKELEILRILSSCSRVQSNRQDGFLDQPFVRTRVYRGNILKAEINSLPFKAWRNTIGSVESDPFDSNRSVLDI